MGLLGSVLGGLSDAGRFVVHGAEDGAKVVASGAKDGAKAVASGVEDGWKSAFNDAKAAAGLLGTGVRSLDAAKEQLGAWIDSGEKHLENKIDEGRAWLRQHGGVAGQVASDWIGFGEGVDISLYDAGKGLMQLADGAGSLANPIEWAANPSANIARVKSTVNTVESLGKIAGLADPASWITNPQGNAELAGALWHRAATSFESDPAKFTGNAIGTIGTLFIPGADAAGVAGDAARVTELTTDASKAAAITPDVSKAVTITQDASNAADAITQDVTKAAEVRRAAEPGKADLDAYRASLRVRGDVDTIAVGRTNVPGLENEVFEGASPRVRKEAGLPDLNKAAPDRPIKSPNPNPQASRHAEEGLANDFVAKAEAAHLKPADLDGKTLNIHISYAKGVCSTCMQGLADGSKAPAGVIKQLSERYPGLTIRITAEDGNAYAGRTVVEIRNGRIIN